MIVKFLKPHHAFSYFEGDTADLLPEDVQELLPGGFVIMFPGFESKSEEPKKPKPYKPQTR